MGDKFFPPMEPGLRLAKRRVPNRQPATGHWPPVPQGWKLIAESFPSTVPPGSPDPAARAEG